MDFEREKSLIDDGLLKESDIIAIITDIMDEFDVEIDAEDLHPGNFNSLDAMLAMIESKLSGEIYR